jgi:F-type H+-transporting ATPase subunit b
MASPAEEAAKSSGLPQFDFNTWPSQVLWLLIVFALLYFVLDRFLLPRLATVIEDRGDRIADNLDAAARMRNEAELAEAQYDKALADARAKAAGIAAEARASADKLIAAETAKAEEDATARLAGAEERIRKMTEDAMASANDVAGEATKIMLDRLAGLKPTAATISKAVSSAGEAKS